MNTRRLIIALALLAAAGCARPEVLRPSAPYGAQAMRRLGATSRPAGQPGPANTGPYDASVLVPKGSVTIKLPGIYENYDISGSLTIQSSDVLLRNFRVRASSSTVYAVKAHYDKRNITLEDGEVTGGDSALVICEGTTLRRLNLHDVGNDAIKVETGTDPPPRKSDVVVENCWVSRLGKNSGAHADGIQHRGGNNLTVTGNFFDMPVGLSGYRSNSAMIVGTDLRPIDNVVIDGNSFNGGGWTIYLQDSGNGGVTNARVTNNRFGRDYRYGLLRLYNTTPVEYHGNVWDDTGEPIPAP